MKRMNFLRIAACVFAVAAALFSVQSTSACTGIALHSKDGSFVVGRTMEWGTFIMESRYMVVPRGHTMIAQTPEGENGLKIVNKYGYVGIGVLEDNLLAEGVNEKGLMGELFYFPGYGKYKDYDEKHRSTSIVDAQFLSWVLANFSTIEEMEKEINNIHVVAYGKGFGTAHFSLADATGREVVLEWLDGKLHVFENKIGVITNAPSFDWHMTNLNSYVNIFAGSAPSHEVVPGVELKAFGIGSASLGLPGDLTPPSRFVRAAFYVHTAIPQPSGYQSAMQIFQILNNFDVPIGAEYSDKAKQPDMLSATQWTTATDLKELKFYYRTQYNSTIRCIDLKTIDFSKVKYQVSDLDLRQQQPIEYIRIK